MQNLKKSSSKTLNKNLQQIILKDTSPNTKILSDLDEIKGGKERDINWMKLWARINLLIAGILLFLFIALFIWSFKGTEKISAFTLPMAGFSFLLNFFLNGFKRMTKEVRCAQKELRRFEEKTVAIFCSLFKNQISDVSMTLELLSEPARIESDVGENRGVGQDDGENTENTRLDAIFKFLKK